MRCIFCKNESSNSKSKEHIIPESLGNTEHILPPGVVCDSCNNYFATQIEGPLLNTHYFLQARQRNLIQNKKGDIPIFQAVHLESDIPIAIHTDVNGSHSIFPFKENDSKDWLKSILRFKSGTLVFPFADEPNDRYLVSRFIGKAAIESLALKLVKNNISIEELIGKRESDLLRDFVRIGNKEKTPWLYSQRKIYPDNEPFPDQKDANLYQILHEFMFVLTGNGELYYVIAIFGIEYAINLAGSSIDGYLDYLKLSNFQSPLLGCNSE